MEILFIQLSDYIKKDPYDWFCGPGSRLCFVDEQKSFGFGTTWVWVNDKRISFLAVNMHMRCFRENVMKSFTEISSAQTQSISASMILYESPN